MSRGKIGLLILQVAALALLVWGGFWIAAKCINGPFDPVQIKRLDVQPREISLSTTDTFTFHNGICSDWDSELTVEVWMAAEPVVDDPLLAGAPVPIVGTSDTNPSEDMQGKQSGRNIITLQPGCSETTDFVVDIASQEVNALLTQLEGGTWRIVTHLVVRGPNNQVQHERKSSEPFTVYE